MSKYEYKCMTCDHIYWFDHGQTYKNCKKCKDKGELRLKSIQHDDFEPEVESVTEDELADQLYGVDNNPEGTFKADAEMQEIKTEKIIEEREEDDEPEMPEGGWECSECGASVDNMNDYCSQGCFNAGMR